MAQEPTGSQDRRRNRRRATGVAGAVLLAGGAGLVGIAAASQQHAPQPARSAAGSMAAAPDQSSVPVSTGPAGKSGAHGPDSTTTTAPPPAPVTAPVQGPHLARSLPVELDVPSIGVHSKLLYLGLNADGTLQVPPLNDPVKTKEAAWYDQSPTPGQVGPSVIEGHVDSAANGPSVFFRLGAMLPGQKIDVTLADGVVAVFEVDGVRSYSKAQFPTVTVYGNTNRAALRLITCGGDFEPPATT
jgi:hypothetical protein